MPPIRIQRRVVDRQDRAEQEAREIDIAAVDRHQEHTEYQRDQVKAGKARILAQRRQPGHETGQQRHDKAGHDPAEAHRR